MADLGAALRTARLAAGVSLSGMAARTSYSKPYLGQLETGRRAVRPEHVTAYERALQVPIPGRAELPDTVLAELQQLMRPVAIRGRVQDAFTGPELEAAQRLAWWARARLWHDSAPPLRPVEAWLQANLNRLQRGPQTKDALRVGADLANLAAAISLDVDDHRGARRRYLLAAKLAHGAGEQELTAAILAGLAYQYIDDGRPADALEVAKLAQYLARHATNPRLQAALAGREAIAHAMLGNPRAFERSIMLEAEFRSDDSPRDLRTAADHSLDAAQLAGVIGPRRHWPSPHRQFRSVGIAYRTLIRTRPQYAQLMHDGLSSVMARACDSVPGSDVLELITRARVHLLLAEPEPAADCVKQILPMADTWATGRATARLRDVHHESAEFDAVPAMREARAAIADALH